MGIAMVDQDIDELWELAKALIGYQISALSEEIYTLEKTVGSATEHIASLIQKKRDLIWERDDLRALDRGVLFAIVEKYGGKNKAC
jgi:regulator of replication initiation timing